MTSKKKSKYITKDILTKGDSVIVIHLNGTVTKGLTHASNISDKKIPNELIVQPNLYDFSGKSYSLKKEGLYRFIIPGKINLQRIVYKNEIDLFLSSICWIVTHGNSDNKKTNFQLTKKALTSKIFITCGKISLWAHYLLKNLNIKSRVVAGMATEEWNSYDNGHTFIEVWRPRLHKWVLYDLANNFYFTSSKNDLPLSLIEFSQLINNNIDYRLIALSSAIRLDISNFLSSDGYNYGFLTEAVQNNIRVWYQRVMQVPLIFNYENNKYEFMNKVNKNKLEFYSQNYRYIPENEFMNKFYSD